MFDIPTIIEAPGGGAAESSAAESSTETGQGAQVSASSGETQTTQAASSETAATVAPAGESAGTKTEEGSQETAPAAETESDTSRFDQHPRWKAMLTQRNEARKQAEALALEKAKLEGRLSALEAAAQPKQQQQQGIDFDAELAAIDAKLAAGDIDIAQARAMERKLNATMVQQQLSSFQSQITEKLTTEQRAAAEQAQVSALTEQFVKANPDFVTFRDAGELEAIRQQDPLHDNVSAYYALKLQKSEEAHKAALESAVKSAEERVRKEFTTKQAAKTMQGSTAAPPVNNGVVAPELKDPKKYGGVAAVLARRLEQRLAAANQ